MKASQVDASGTIYYRSEWIHNGRSMTDADEKNYRRLEEP
jgi:hypothetical protein